MVTHSEEMRAFLLALNAALLKCGVPDEKCVVHPAHRFDTVLAGQITDALSVRAEFDTGDPRGPVGANMTVPKAVSTDAAVVAEAAKQAIRGCALTLGWWPWPLLHDFDLATRVGTSPPPQARAEAAAMRPRANGHGG